jgi:hypothetical protein
MSSPDAEAAYDYGAMMTMACVTSRPSRSSARACAHRREDGISCGNLYDAETKQSLISIARDVVLVADHSKFGKIAAVTVAPLTAVRTVISDEGLDPSTHHALTNKGLTVRLAPVRPGQTDGASDGTARP